MKLSKEQKRERDNLERALSKLLVELSFHKIKTFNDLLKKAGHTQEYIDSRYFPSEKNHLVTREEVLDWISDRKIELSTRQWLTNNPPDLTIVNGAIEEIYEQKTIQNDGQSGAIIHIENLVSKGTDSSGEGKIKVLEKPKDTSIVFEKSPNDPKETYFAIHQKKAINSLWDNIIHHHYRGQYLIGQGGSGKTWVFGEVMRRALDIGLAKLMGSVSPWPYIIVTKASVVEKTTRDLRRYFNIRVPQDCLVIGIDSLRSKFGELFVEEITEIEGGIEYTKWKWRDLIYPCFIIWDEGHVLKNYTSIQHKIACSYNELPNTVQIFSSATPLSKVSEGKCFAISTRISSGFAGVVPTEINNSTWLTFAKNVAAPATPIEYSPPAVARFRSIMEPYIVEMSNVRPQFKARNKVTLIDFTSDEGREHYFKAEEKMMQKLNKIKNNDKLDNSQKYLHQFAVILAYRIAAEGNPDMIKYLCEKAYEDVFLNGKAALFAVCFKETLVKMVKYLVYNKNVPRNMISVIWGGGIKAPSDKQKAKHVLVNDPEVAAMMESLGLSFDDLGLDDTEAKMEQEEVPDELDLGSMTKMKRQKEIDRYQQGKTLFCIYTFRAGGTGLSLHHTDEFTNRWKEEAEGFKEWYQKHHKNGIIPGKVRHKESGYAYEEDIPFIPTRPRVTRVCPTWSPPELVQGVCRGPRLTSLSDTEQELVFFKGTIQEQVAAKSSMGLASLGKMVKQNESWLGFVFGAALAYVKEELKESTDVEETMEEVFIEESETNDTQKESN